MLTDSISLMASASFQVKSAPSEQEVENLYFFITMILDLLVMLISLRS